MKEKLRIWLFPKTVSEYGTSTVINLRITIFFLSLSIVLVITLIVLRHLHGK